MRRLVRLAALLLCVFCALASASPATVNLADGRVLRGRGVSTSGDHIVLDTVFGPLRVPRVAICGPERTTTDAPAVHPIGVRRETRTKWFIVESDLSDARAKLYADQLDAFFDWMIGVFGIETKAAMRRVPYRAYVYASRADFKKVQNDVAPSIAASKGTAFAEGVAGFFSPASFHLYLWDVEGADGSANLEVAKHETTHLLNQLLSETHAIKLPQWFNEGGATYFSTATAVAGGEGKSSVAEPDDHPAALGTVIDEIESGKPMTAREIRSVGYDAFLGREYCWGWALVRWFRKTQGGKHWPALLDHLRTIGSGAAVSDSEDKRFLVAAGTKDDKAFDQAWYASLTAAHPGGKSSPVGASNEALAAVDAIAKPTAAQARTFAQLGASFARTGQPKAAITYLRAALRGGDRSGETQMLLATVIAADAGADETDKWPDETLPLVRDAVDAEPLRGAYRLALGRQMLHRAASPGETAAARDALGLALLVCGPGDDSVTVATSFVRAAAAASPATSLDELDAALARDLPDQVQALRIARLYFLQEERRWDELLAVLELRVAQAAPTFEERTMLAGLYRAGDRLDDAEKLYAKLLAEIPAALQLWPDRIDCLFRLGRREDALAAKREALDRIAKDSREWQGVRDRIERLGQ